jgi:hypothetical protein
MREDLNGANTYQDQEKDLHQLGFGERNNLSDKQMIVES